MAHLDLLDLLEGWTVQKEPLTEEDLNLGLGILAAATPKIPHLPRRSQVLVGRIVAAYCDRAALEVPPDRAERLRTTAAKIRGSIGESHRG